ncbi:MAG: orotate phosphoribosyltransferase [Tenuifilaceae bacterium]|jgi:orotate phosphoribosyltransferase|nr:orotate phosphoribosyltransferase [Tenuifilaceae bacterium]
MNNRIISKLIEINAIKLNPANPFTWASGWHSPIYCDNRRVLSYPDARKIVCAGFIEIITKNFANIDVIAGVATGAIAHGALVAEALGLPFVYVRSEAKKHGLENLIEGDIKVNQRVVVIEDLVSTGLSSLKAVDALRNANTNVLGMVAIFTYGFDVAKQNFDQHNLPLYTLANYHELIDYALSINMIDSTQLEVLKSWRQNPQEWGK